MRFALCVANRGAGDLDLRRVYRVVPDKGAAAGHIRVIDESGEDYLYPENYFVLVELSQRARRAWKSVGRRNVRTSSPKKRRPGTTTRAARPAR